MVAKTSRNKVTSKSTRQTIKASHANIQNSSTYQKLIKKGMTPKQAAAFARHAGGSKKSGAKSSKGVTKRVTSRGKKK